jgi:hypothetical protein
MDNFQELPPYCEQCPISIQEGMTCGDNGIGSHYINHSTMERDPWTTDCGAYFKTDSQEMGMKRPFFLDIGHGYLETKEYAVLLKGPDHSCIACGILSSKKAKVNIFIILRQFVTINRYKITAGDTKKPCFVPIIRIYVSDLEVKWVINLNTNKFFL